MPEWGLALVRSHAVPALQSRLSRLAEIFGADLGVKLAPFPAPSYLRIYEALAQGKVGIAWVPPMLAVDLEDRGSAHLVGIPARSGKDTYRSVLIVAKGDSRDLESFKGSTIAWVDPQSASGYLVPRAHLASKGFDPRSFFGKEVMVGTHSSVADAVSNGRADIGATFCTFGEDKAIVTAGWLPSNGRRTREVDLLWTSDPIPNDAFVVSSLVPDVLRKAIGDWLLDPPPNARQLLLELVGAESCARPDEAHFGPLRDLMGSARKSGYSLAPPHL